MHDSVCAKVSVEGRLSDEKLHQQMHAHPLQLFITKCVSNQHEYTGHIQWQNANSLGQQLKRFWQFRSPNVEGCYMWIFLEDSLILPKLV